MARPLRIEQAGGWYHVTARGNERKSIFRDHRDRQHFLELMAEMVSRFRGPAALFRVDGQPLSPSSGIDRGQSEPGDVVVERQMTPRPSLQAVIAAVEKVKGRQWAAFRDEYGDTGRDLTLYLGRRVCGMKLKELAKAVDLRNYGVVATNSKRYELRLERDSGEKARMKRVLDLLNCEM